jgi:hypothetical protein
MDGLVKGKKYKVRYRIGMQRNDREAVMVFLGVNDSLLLWSARPVAGTQQLYSKDLKEATQVSDDTVVYLNRIVK